MPARVIQNAQGGNKNNPENKQQMKTPQVEIKVDKKNEGKIQEEMKAVISENVEAAKDFSSIERAQFYTGSERLDLQGVHVQRVRELQEENDHLQREISAKEQEISNCQDPLAILADIEHRKIIVARNTGEILKIYLKNEERIKRIKELETKNARIQKEMMEMQGRFISTHNLDEKTKVASEFFILKCEIENNISEIAELKKN